MDLVIVTGLSGSGRRSVLSALEDSGFTAIDNVPPRLLPSLLELETKLNPHRPHLAVGIDSRQTAFADEFIPLLESLRRNGVPVQVFFVESDDQTLLRRFSESRRPHHLAEEDGNLSAAIQRERHLLEPIRLQASTIIDTSNLNLSQLRMRIRELLPALPGQDTTLRLISFGFKFGLPDEADMVLDARFLPNPHYDVALRPLTGLDKPVKDFLNQSEAYHTFLHMALKWIRWEWPFILEEGRAYHTVAIGCTGGQHRSVALIEALAHHLQRDIPGLVIQHRELKTAP